MTKKQAQMQVDLERRMMDAWLDCCIQLGLVGDSDPPKWWSKRWMAYERPLLEKMLKKGRQQ